MLRELTIKFLGPLGIAIDKRQGGATEGREKSCDRLAHSSASQKKGSFWGNRVGPNLSHSSGPTLRVGARAVYFSLDHLNGIDRLGLESGRGAHFTETEHFCLMR